MFSERLAHTERMGERKDGVAKAKMGAIVSPSRSHVVDALCFALVSMLPCWS